jgi:NADPH-dependent ferric siderophore reductase
MNKAVTPEQFELVEAKADQIFGTEAPALKASLEKIKPIAVAETAVLKADENDFNWNDDDSIILREQPATAIYHNRYGVLVIRQKADWDAEHDTFAFITPENAVVFMEAFAKVARE